MTPNRRQGGNPAGGLQAADLRPGSVASSEVANGSLNDEDVGQAAFVNFAANIGTVDADTCVRRFVTGVNAQGDHWLLTPSDNNSDPRLDYSIQNHFDTESAAIVVCNHDSTSHTDGTTNFNLLVFDAQ